MVNNMTLRGPQDDTPLVDYVTSKLWGNPEENKQHQVRVSAITGSYGVIKSFPYMNRWRSTPLKTNYYHVFTAGGLHPGYWNFINDVLRRSPFDKWINLSKLSSERGFQTDVYNSKGIQYSRSKSWVMKTNDGLTLIAIEKMRNQPIDDEADLYFRCYTSSLRVDTKKVSVQSTSNPYLFTTMVFEGSAELAIFTNTYNLYKSKPGYTGVFWNGLLWNGPPNTIPNLKLDDVVEIWHDPTVIRVETYDYSSLRDYYSTLDQKRKVILHPPKRKGDFRLRYFDDNDYYLLGNNNKGIYFHRNSVTTVRQLTHVDVSLADDAIRSGSENLPDLENIADLKIMVLVRETDWNFNFPNEHHRIRYLYRLPDTDIVKAFTGARANMDEWTADKLESGSTLSLIRSQFKRVTRENVLNAIGYNAATRVLGENVLKVAYNPGINGVEIPYSYRASCNVWEYNAEGLLLGYNNSINARYYSPTKPTCSMVEFVMGEASDTIDSLITNEDTPLTKEFDYRVYTSGWDTNNDKLVGKIKDVTGRDDIYFIEDGVLRWESLDKVNQRGVIISNRKALVSTFQLDHLDHSLSFSLVQPHTPLQGITNISLAQVDIWLNGHPLIDNVDWLLKDKRCYIINKEFIVPGAQTITTRLHSFSDDMDKPIVDTELGFVDGGVIGRFKKYNLRGDRTTRTVINGRLFVSDDVPRAEREVPDEQWDVLNGKPYMVKHVYTPLVLAKDHCNFPLIKESRSLDKRVSDYLTKYLVKPQTNDEEITWEGTGVGRPYGTGVPALPNLSDKYRLYSPFLNAVVNGILRGFITIPNISGVETTFSNQDVSEAVKSLVWWLEFDPITLNFDRRYFAILPYANFNKLVVSSKEFQFIKQVNDLYLNSVCSIEGHFEVQ